jgi:NADP-dependent 3-hydroxy acid dehydrogenase YdfG
MPQTPTDQAAFEELFRAEPQPVEGKACLVTGGTTGLGRAIAMLLVARGARVLIFGRHEKELNDALSDIKRVGGGQIFGMVADASKREEAELIFREVDGKLGGLDILVSNAGLAASSVTDTDYDEWRTVIDTNLTAYLLFSKHAIQRMKPKKDGHLIFIGSMSAENRSKGSDVYVATKSGVRGFSQSLAKSVNADGIRVTLIEPGLVGADMTEEKVPKEKQAQQEKELKLLRAEEIAHAVLYVLEQPKRCNVGLIQIRPTANEA